MPASRSSSRTVSRRAPRRATALSSGAATRAVLPEIAARRMTEVARAYTTLEYDLEGGRRGSRSTHLDRLFALLFPGRAFHIVNNNAAAVLLALNTFAEGREVIVSRGELVEIGGSFRIPDVMRKSGAILKEIGTTNRTRLAGYEPAPRPRNRPDLQG